MRSHIFGGSIFLFPHITQAWLLLPSVIPDCKAQLVCSSHPDILVCECYEASMRDSAVSGGTIAMGSRQVHCSLAQASPPPTVFNPLKTLCEYICECSPSTALESGSNTATLENPLPLFLPLAQPPTSEIVGSIAQQMATMILEAQAQAKTQAQSPEQMSAVVSSSLAEHESSKSEIRTESEDIEIAFTSDEEQRASEEVEQSANEEEEEEEEEEEKEQSAREEEEQRAREEEDQNDLNDLTDILLRLKTYAYSPPPPPPNGGSDIWAIRRRRTARFKIGVSSSVPTKKTSRNSGESRRGQGRGRERGQGGKKSTCSIRCNNMIGCSILEDTTICSNDMVCSADPASAGQYFGLGWCLDRTYAASLASASQLLGRSLDESQTGQLEEGVACLCNSSYVSKRCCEEKDGLVWESPDSNLLTSLEDL